MNVYRKVIRLVVTNIDYLKNGICRKTNITHLFKIIIIINSLTNTIIIIIIIIITTIIISINTTIITLYIYMYI